MPSRMGRPKTQNPKDIRYSIRIDQDTEVRLLKYCNKHGITRGEAFRKAIFELLDKK